MNTNWLDNYYDNLEGKRGQISDSDFRFFNLNRLPLIAKKTNEYEFECPECKANKNILEEMNDLLPGCLEDFSSRKNFENKRNSIEKHLKKVHQLRHAHYFFALYSFIGLVIGAITGLMIPLIVFNKINVNALLIICALGLFFGQIIGKRKDRTYNKRGLQI